jgi:hypothetical protein
MALGLCVIWSYGGALSFGQTAFFGIADYSYGVITLNWGADYGLTLWATLAAVALSAIVARLSRAAHSGKLIVRKRAGRGPRKSRARHDARLRRAQVPARGLCDR